MSKATDLVSETGAARLAHAIRVYWQDKGHRVQAVAEPVQGKGEAHWAVRSDMRNGLPRKAARCQ